TAAPARWKRCAITRPAPPAAAVTTTRNPPVTPDAMIVPHAAVLPAGISAIAIIFIDSPAPVNLLFQKSETRGSMTIQLPHKARRGRRQPPPPPVAPVDPTLPTSVERQVYQR